MQPICQKCYTDDHFIRRCNVCSIQEMKLIEWGNIEQLKKELCYCKDEVLFSHPYSIALTTGGGGMGPLITQEAAFNVCA